MTNQAGLRIEPAVLEQRKAHAHDHAAVDLAACRQRIDNQPRVVHGDNLEHAHHAGLDIDPGKLASCLVVAKTLANSEPPSATITAVTWMKRTNRRRLGIVDCRRRIVRRYRSRR